MRIEDFALERFFARWEFVVRHQLSASDVEALPMRELLALADDDGLARWENLSLGYTESSGLGPLRAEIATMYEHVEPDGVFVVAGAEEGIFLTMHAVLEAGDEAVVVTPAYQSLHAIPRFIGATVRCVELRESDRWELNLDELAAAVTNRTRVIAVNYPHNPTGAHLSADAQRRLVAIAEEAGAVLFFDEVYRGLEYESRERLPATADLSARAVSLGVMSKTFALPGLRIGWIATRNRAVLDAVTRLRDYTTICNSAPSEVLALIALRAREKVLARAATIVRSNLDAAVRFMRDRSDAVAWVPPRAGSIALPRFLREDADAVSSTLAQRASTLLMPGRVFGAGASHFRLGLGRSDFPVALGHLGQVLNG